MSSVDKRYQICFNGEIYNYLEMADELGLDGDSPIRSSDTAVFLEAVRRWGCVEALRRSLGMFALGLWDCAERTLHLARDAAGKKPIYGGVFDRTFYFASEIQAFRSVSEFNLTFSREQIADYLTFGFIPTPSTVYKELSMLPPGSVVSVSSDLQMRFERYLRPRPTVLSNISEQEAVQRTEDLLSDAVRLRLRSDVPLGCFLSGGIDSGLITALATRHISRPLKTYTVSLRGYESGEGPLAELTARHYGTEHREIVVDAAVADILPKIIRAYGQPFADASAVPSYLVAEAARKEVTVILTGDGADELFGGYRRQFVYGWADLLSPLSMIFPRGIVAALPTPAHYRSRYAFVHRFLRGLHQPLAERYISYCMDGFTEAEKSDLFQERHGFRAASQVVEKHLAELKDGGDRERMLATDFSLNLHDDMLVKMDIASMAHSLEARSPFLDVRLIEWTQSLPFTRKIYGSQTKPLLRAIARKLLPNAVAAAPKRGFEIPINVWLRRELRPLSVDAILDSRGLARELFSATKLEALIENKVGLDPDRWARRVWSLLILSLWARGDR
jgi:asparagine synthase (glutamine-hydrolysing)